MYNIPVMGRLQSHGNLNRYAGSFFDRQLSFLGNILFQSNSFYQFHHNVINAMILPYVKNIHYIGMCQACRRLGFSLKFPDKISICAEFRLQHLHSYKPIQLMIFRFIYIGHAPGTDPADHLIAFSYDYSHI